MLISILIFLILLAHLPWIAIIVVYPWNVLAVYTWLHPQKRWARPLAIPYRVVARFTRSGWEKFCAVHVGHLPSYHLRKWMYKDLECNVRRMSYFGMAQKYGRRTICISERG